MIKLFNNSVTKEELIDELKRIAKESPEFGLKIIGAIYEGALKREADARKFSVFMETAFVAKDLKMEISSEGKSFLTEHKSKFAFADTFEKLVGEDVKTLRKVKNV